MGYNEIWGTYKLILKNNHMKTPKRPTKLTLNQKYAFHRGIANLISENGWSESPVHDIILDLTDISEIDSAFEIAKKLEGVNSNAFYDISTNFINFLDDFQHFKRMVLEREVETWVQKYKPQNRYNEGMELIIKKKLTHGMPVGLHIHIIKIWEIEAAYVVNFQKDATGGTVLPFELVENNCEVI